VLALLARRFGDLDIADDAVQEALIDAAIRWPVDGVPTNIAGWLYRVAQRKAIDATRRASSQLRRAHDFGHAMAVGHQSAQETNDYSNIEGRDNMAAANLYDDSDDIDDERLRLMLLCCHPALDRDTQVALTLRLVGGLTTVEIAAAFMVPEATLAQRIVRAKRKIRDAAIPMTVPAQLTTRVDAILSVLYLIFNEGYLSRSSEAASLVRLDLASEAIRLTEAFRTLLPEPAEADGLLALQLFHHARTATRANADGDLVLLEDQDRSQWDLALIAQANTVLRAAMRQMQPGHYQLQAVIASYHANARTTADTDWSAIASVYRQLVAMTQSPVIALNHAAAISMADGPAAGLVALDAIANIDSLENYHLLHATRADFYRRLDRPGEATASYRKALVLTNNVAEQRFLKRRLAELSP
jgi:RNA polymerase sigma-70 factor, ECF subfamily